MRRVPESLWLLVLKEFFAVFCEVVLEIEVPLVHEKESQVCWASRNQSSGGTGELEGGTGCEYRVVAEAETGNLEETGPNELSPDIVLVEN